MRPVFANLYRLRRHGRRVLLPAASLAIALGLCQCSSTSTVRDADVVVSVPDQKLGYYRDGNLVQSYKVSTSKFGIGDAPGSCCTPLGKHEVVAKIGHGLPAGAVLKSRQWNGEVLKPNAPGRDPVVSRIMWLSGLESDNHNALKRFIYIHGTTEENRLGKPASYGCVRMSMGDVISLFNEVDVGAKVVITKEHLPTHETMVAAQTKPVPATPTPPASSNPPIEIQSGSSSTPPGEIHSEYQPAHPGQGPVNAEPTSNGKQRLLIPVGHSLGKTSKKSDKEKTAAPAKKDQAVTMKGQKKSDPTPTSNKKRKKEKDKTLAAA